MSLWIWDLASLCERMCVSVLCFCLSLFRRVVHPQPLMFAFQVQVGVQGFVLGYQRVPHIDAGKGLGFRA